MLKMGFSQRWVSLVMKCVESVTFSFLLNEEPKGLFRPTRGLCQGDPISPYLFLFCAKGLSYLLDQTTRTGRLHRHRICRGAPVISHLLFADETMIFCQADESQADEVKDILSKYEDASGQQINFHKSQVVFSKGTPQARRDNIPLQLDIREVLAHDKYLGLPTYVGRSKKKSLVSVKDRVSKRLHRCMNRYLSWAVGKCLLKLLRKPSRCML